MIPRIIQSQLLEYAQSFPVVSLLGPRQSGKTTLCKNTFPNKPYISLEDYDVREYAQADPRGFLSQYPQGAIFDEMQNVPILFSYIQTIVDILDKNGVFVLTGSQNFLLARQISQSLAGRVGILTLLPLSNRELKQSTLQPPNAWDAVWKGGYPRLYKQKNHKILSPQKWISSYIQTYIERDVRDITAIGDLSLFRTFMSLLASHTGQEVNYNTLSNDLGISHNTVKSWIGILEQSYIIGLLPSWHTNIKKQIIKSPKLHFLDTGIVCALLKIQSPQMLQLHPLRGAIFESWIYSEVLKNKYNTGERHDFFHYREKNGLEFDIVKQKENTLIPYEIKSSQTVHPSFFKNFSLQEKRKNDQFSIEKSLVFYTGDMSQKRSFISVCSWKEI